MAKFTSDISPTLQEFISNQQMFFVATAAASGHINLSPKGMDSFRCLDSVTVAYLDLTGSGNETAAHLLTDGRITIMFCAFEGNPLILRLYGRGERISLDSDRGKDLHELFPSIVGERQLIILHVDSVQTSCGFAVPKYEFKENRDLLVDWAMKKGPERLVEYRRTNNQVSIDGFPTGLEE